MSSAGIQPIKDAPEVDVERNSGFFKVKFFERLWTSPLKDSPLKD